MTLEICVIDTDTGFLYEWNGSQTVNVYSLAQYQLHHNYPEYKAAQTMETLNMWMMEADKPTAEDFIANVKEHIEGG